MNRDEAATLARIAVTVDNGCSICICELFDQLERAFPDQPWVELLDEIDPVSCELFVGDDE